MTVLCVFSEFEKKLGQKCLRNAFLFANDSNNPARHLKFKLSEEFRYCVLKISKESFLTTVCQLRVVPILYKEVEPAEKFPLFWYLNKKQKSAHQVHFSSLSLVNKDKHVFLLGYIDKITKLWYSDILSKIRWENEFIIIFKFHNLLEEFFEV